MDRPLLFAETPRAGRWNHRFLVPEEFAMGEEQLAEQAARARQKIQGSDYLAVIRQVEQPSSGRMADEILVLYGIAVDHLDAATRRILINRLEVRLDDLQHLVEAVDWEQEGKRLVVRRHELTEWFNADFAAELAACRGPAPLDAGDEDARGAAKKGRWALPLIGLALAVAALLVWRPWSSEELPITPEPRAEASQVDAPEAAEMRAMEAPLRKLADQWRMPERRDPLPRLCQAVVEKLEEDFAIQPVNTNVSADQRLADLIHSLSDQLLRSKRQNDSLLSRLEDSGFQRRLMSVYGARGLDYAAPLRLLIAPNDYDRQQHVRALMALCPGENKEQVREFRELLADAKQLTLDAAAADELTGDTASVQRLHDAARAAATLRWQASVGAAGMPLAILNQQDASDAAVLLSWLSRAGFSEAVGASEEATLAAAKRYVQDKRDFLEVVSTQDPPGKRLYAIQCAKLLLRIAR